MTTPVLKQTVLNHPSLPQNISLIERITLPVVFSLIANLSRSDQHREQFREYMEPLRDALNEAYPVDNSAGGDVTGAGGTQPVPTAF